MDASSKSIMIYYFIINAKADLKHDWFNTYFSIKTNEYVQTSLIYIDVIDAQ